MQESKDKVVVLIQTEIKEKYQYEKEKIDLSTVKYRIVARHFKNKVVKIYGKHLITVTSLLNEKSNED